MESFGEMKIRKQELIKSLLSTIRKLQSNSKVECRSIVSRVRTKVEVCNGSWLELN